MNHSYGQTFGPYAPGTYAFTLYGQVDSRTANGTRVVVTFNDGTSLTANLPSSSYHPYAFNYPTFYGAGMTANVWSMFLNLFKGW